MTAGAPGHADSSGRRVGSLGPRAGEPQVVLGLVRHKVLLAAYPDHASWLILGHALQHRISSTWRARAYQ